MVHLCTRLSAAMSSRIAALSVLNATSRLSVVLGGVRFPSGKNSDHSGPSKDRIDSARFLGVVLKVVELSAYFVPMGSLETFLQGKRKVGGLRSRTSWNTGGSDSLTCMWVLSITLIGLFLLPIIWVHRRQAVKVVSFCLLSCIQSRTSHIDGTYSTRAKGLGMEVGC